MTELREAAEDSQRATTSPERALEQATSRDRRHQRRRAVGTVAVALLLAAAPMELLWKGFLGNQTPPDNAATPSEESGPVEPVVVANIPVGNFPSFITVGEGSVWVAVESGSGGDSLIARIDPATNEVLETISLDEPPGQLAFEDGSLWIGLPGSVRRVDPESGQVIAEIAGPGTFVTRTPGAIWALDSANSIARIDPMTNQVAATMTLDLPADGYVVSPPVGTPDAVWVMAFLGDEEADGGGNGELVRIDPITNSVVASFDLGMAGAFAVDDAAVWVVSGLAANGTSLTRIDTATNQAVEQIDLDGQWTPFAVGAGSLWLMGGMQPEILVAGLYLSTVQMGEQVVVGELPAFEGSGIFDPEADALWISQQESLVTRVELRSTTATGGSAASGVIAFGCGYHICTVRPDGSGFTDLIGPYDKELVLAAYSPVFSPDGSRIAFRGYPKGAVSGGANYDIYVMGADGTGLMNLTGPGDPQGQGYSQWSPDGSMIAYDGDDGLYVMNADGSGQRKLASGANATWSPDGSWIAFVMGRDHGADLWKIHPDGTGLTQLTQSTGWDELPVWSPDGFRIAFLRDRTIYVVDQDGTGLTVVADIKGAYPFQPQWSPDGTMLAFEVEMPATPDAEAAGERNYDIFRVNADGSGLVNLTPTTDITENYPIWSPDGTKIAFGASDVLSGENAGTFDLYTVNLDGTGIERLTTDAGLGVEFDISWQRTSS